VWNDQKVLPLYYRKSKFSKKYFIFALRFVNIKPGSDEWGVTLYDYKVEKSQSPKDLLND